METRHKQLLAEAANNRLVKQANGMRAPLDSRLMAWLADRLINTGMFFKRQANNSAKQVARMSTGFMI